MKIRSIQTCIMSSLPGCIFRCSVFRYVISVRFFFKNLLLDCNSFILVANKYLLTYLLSSAFHRLQNHVLLVQSFKNGRLRRPSKLAFCFMSWKTVPTLCKGSHSDASFKCQLGLRVLFSSHSL